MEVNIDYMISLWENTKNNITQKLNMEVVHDADELDELNDKLTRANLMLDTLKEKKENNDSDISFCKGVVEL